MPRTSMDGRKNDSVRLTTKKTEWNFNYVGSISLAFGGFLLLGCFSAYIIAVARGNVDAFLPLISDAAGSPPQNGLFGTFLCLGGMFGVAFMILRYMIVLEKNREKSNLVTIINKLSLFIGIASMLGVTLVTGYPINFYRNRDVWLLDVGLPHIIGGVMLFAFGLLYIALQCMLSLFLKTKSKLTLFVRILMLFICSASFVYHMITVPDNFGGISHKYYMNSTELNEFNTTGLLPYPSTLGTSLKLPIEKSSNYTACSVTEWIFVIFFCAFFFTFFNEAQQYSLLIVIETHSIKEPEVIQDRKAEIRRLSMAIEKSQLVNTKPVPEIASKPAPEVRKFLRRDSTCQTMTDNVTDQIPKDNKDSSNGVKKTISVHNQSPAKKEVANGTKINQKNGTDSKSLVNEKDKPKMEELKSENVSTNQRNLPSQNGAEKNAFQTDTGEESEKSVIRKEEAVQNVGTETAKITQDNGENQKNDSDDVLPSTCPLSIQ